MQSYPAYLPDSYDNRTSNYNYMTEIQHVLEKSQVYGMGVKNFKRDEWMWNGTAIIKVKTVSPMGMNRAFIEIISNAADETFKARGRNQQPGAIIVTVNDRVVTIYNDHVNIPVSMMDSLQGRVYVPQAIFGQLRTSGNYGNSNGNEKREGSGTNGIGSKATNVFSSMFKIRLCDAIKGLNYCQEWRSNMSQVSQPIIVNSGPVQCGWILVEYELDFPRFGCNGYTTEHQAMFYRNCIDMSYCSKSVVVFNGISLDYRSSELYVRTYFPTTSKLLEFNMQGIDENNHPYSLTVILVDTDESTPPANNGYLISFVNCLNTPDHGTHTKSAVKVIVEQIKKEFNGSLPDDAKKITNSDVIKNLNMFVIAQVTNPEFKGADKYQCIYPDKIRFTVEPSKFKQLIKWNCMKRLKEQSDQMRQKVIASTDGKKVKRLPSQYSKKVSDAEWAGTSRSEEAVLIIVEGDSAEPYAEYYINNMPGGRSKYGIIKYTGKIPNSAKHEKNPEKLIKSESIVILKQVVGLRSNVDYSNPANMKDLRYGRIIIMTDSDHDGNHITSLTLTFFRMAYIALLFHHGFIGCYRTPIIRSYRGKESKRFLTYNELEVWKQNELASGRSLSSWTFKLFKGLGSSDTRDVKDDIANPMIVYYRVDANGIAFIDLAMRADTVDNRKNWIRSTQYSESTPHIVKSDDHLSNFYRNEYMDFMIASLERGIACNIDGLKESHRKIMWSSYKNKQFPSHDFKVTQFGGYVSQKTDYEHGEDSLFKTIIGMGQTLAGSNNMEYLRPIGMFGTRSHGGKNKASPRYIFVNRVWWYSLVFKSEDIPLLQFRDNGAGGNIEPKYMLPIIPLHIINGSNGTACAYKSVIPAHNPLDIVDWLIGKLTLQLDLDFVVLPELTPWYRYYEGNIRLDKDDNGINMLASSGRYYQYIIDPTNQAIRIDGMEHSAETANIKDSIVVVTDLPIQTYPMKYKKMLDKMIDDGELTDYNNHSYTDTTMFVLYNQPRQCSSSSLKLECRHRLTDLVEIDEHSRVVESNNIISMLESFFKLRLHFYEARRQSIIKELSDELDELHLQYKFISLCHSKDIVINDEDRTAIKARMEMYNLPYRLYTRAKLKTLDRNTLTKLNIQIREVNEKLVRVQQSKPEQLWMNDLILLRSALQMNHIRENLRFQYNKLELFIQRYTENTDVIREAYLLEFNLTMTKINQLKELEIKWKSSWNDSKLVAEHWSLRIEQNNDHILNISNSIIPDIRQLMMLLQQDINDVGSYMTK